MSISLRRPKEKIRLRMTFFFFFPALEIKEDLTFQFQQKTTKIFGAIFIFSIRQNNFVIHTHKNQRVSLIEGVHCELIIYRCLKSTITQFIENIFMSIKVSGKKKKRKKKLKTIVNHLEHRDVLCLDHHVSCLNRTLNETLSLQKDSISLSLTLSSIILGISKMTQLKQKFDICTVILNFSQELRMIPMSLLLRLDSWLILW